jgi:hypothetical protein
MMIKIIMTPSWKAIPANIKLEAASGEGVTDAAHPPPMAWRTRETISAVRKIATNYMSAYIGLLKKGRTFREVSMQKAGLILSTAWPSIVYLRSVRYSHSM